VLLFKKVLKKETAPNDWKDANVVPKFKTGQRSVAANYRPVSLISQICKVFEAIVWDEIVEFLDEHKLIRDTQHHHNMDLERGDHLSQICYGFWIKY